MNISFRPCGDCVGCCSGKLAGNIYGHIMNNEKPCFFLRNNKCSIYNDRPNSPCRNYQCAYTQHLLDEDMRPDKIGLIVSVEIDDEGQHLKIVQWWDKVPEENYKRVEDCAKRIGARLKGMINE